ncbi:MAG: molybdopterin molybdotransferase MoeA [Sulfolobaceae archaeon]|nr:molybdopterin molybdotransferase MoeA [Sulfolobaceae archaeon]
MSYLKNYLNLDNAIKVACDIKFEFTKQKVSVQDAVGYYAAETVASPKNFPPYDRSAVDGYAVIHDDVISASSDNPVFLKEVGLATADKPYDKSIKNGECVRVLTGAKIPEGADAVVMEEDTRKISPDTIAVLKSVRKYQNISRVGEDIKIGKEILRKGERIRSWHVPALLEVNIDEIYIWKLRICVLSTGDELVKGSVKNTTQPMLLELIREYGFDPISLGISEDDAEKIREILDKNNSSCDIYIVTGGTGPSEKDESKQFLSTYGKLIFHGLNIRPSRTTGFGIYNNKPVFIISGLPVAALIAFENVIFPIISCWLGLEKPKECEISGILDKAVVNIIGVKSFVRVKIYEKDGKIHVDPLKVTGSGIISSIIDADGYLILDENTEGLPEGSTVKVKLIR